VRRGGVDRASRENRGVGSFVIGLDDPRARDVAALLDEHLAYARRHTPPADVHALDAAARVAEHLVYFTVRDGGRLLGVGALSQLDDRHAEIKSMHVAGPERGRGVGRALLDHLVQVARERGCDRVSLETGASEGFAAARGLYASAGFEACEPFGEYGPNSVYMTLPLA